MTWKSATRTGAHDKEATENDRGTGPVTSASPAPSADKNDTAIEYRPFVEFKRSATEIELPRHDNPSAGFESTEKDDASDIDVDTIFRRKLMGLRLLPRRERAQAYRAAKEWRRVALKALREKRTSERHARYMLRQLKRIRPSGLDWR
jgi:hypothetical protein